MLGLLYCGFQQEMFWVAAGPFPLQTGEGQLDWRPAVQFSAGLLSGDTCRPSGLLELRLCWALCPGEVRGGQSLAQDTKGELGGFVGRGMALKRLWAKGLLTSGDPAFGAGLGAGGGCLIPHPPQRSRVCPRLHFWDAKSNISFASRPGHL